MARHPVHRDAAHRDDAEEDDAESPPPRQSKRTKPRSRRDRSHSVVTCILHSKSRFRAPGATALWCQCEELPRDSQPSAEAEQGDVPATGGSSCVQVPCQLCDEPKQLNLLLRAGSIKLELSATYYPKMGARCKRGFVLRLCATPSPKVHSADKILELLNIGNSRRKTESTEANATSSRSHAVLEITVKRKQKGQHSSRVLRGKLALVDLAGSERASETNNFGQKLRDGANINRSLLALANCINALGKQNKKGLAYVPYRNSKLTRILKDGLSGNSRTVMVATISPADDQYHHTTNTLKYADRAKEIKTHVHKNIGMLDTHVEDYQRMIQNLQVEVSQLKKELADKEHQLSVKPTEKAADSELSWLNILSQETGENVQERINLQKALFELEETNKRNRMELQHLDDAIARQQVKEKDSTGFQALVSRRQVILDNIRDNDEAGAGYRKDIELNESRRRQLQDMIEEATNNNANKTYLHILSQYRLLGMTNAELQIEMAIRDQVIHNQREGLRSLWNILYGAGLNQKQILKLAAKQGLTIDGCPLPISSPSVTTPPPSCVPHGRLPQFMSFPSPQSQSSPSACFIQHGFSTMSVVKSQHETPTICRQEHLSSYYMTSDGSPYAGDGKQWANGRSTPYFSTPGKPRETHNFCPGTKVERSPYSGEHPTSHPGNEGFSLQRKELCSRER